MSDEGTRSKQPTCIIGIFPVNNSIKAVATKIFKNKLIHNTKNELISEINLIIMPKKYILRNKKNTSILSWLS